MKTGNYETIEDFVNAIPGDSMREKILFWIAPGPCVHTVPLALGDSSQVMSLSHEACPTRCLRDGCLKLFDAHVKAFETYPARGRDLEVIRAGLKFMDSECRAVCDCHKTKFDRSRLFKFSEVARCENCSHIVGKIGITV